MEQVLLPVPFLQTLCLGPPHAINHELLSPFLVRTKRSLIRRERRRFRKSRDFGGPARRLNPADAPACAPIRKHAKFVCPKKSKIYVLTTQLLFCDNNAVENYA